MQDQLHEKHFVQLAQLVEDHTGIKLPPGKRTMVEGRLRKRVRALGLAGLQDYGDAIFVHGKLDDEFPHLVDCVTTNKTDFFREPEHFNFLSETIVPTLLAERRSDARLKIWSAASSTGAEAYTIAMVLADMLGDKGPINCSILGTDICRDVLQQARRAVYPLAMIDPIPQRFRQRYVMRSVNALRQEMRIVPEIRRLARFQHLNLMDDFYPFDRDVDVIFCRNILIYFEREKQDAVINRLSGHLRPGGYLLLGHSESLAGTGQTFLQQVAPTIFRKIR
jgi:chemotaxis protein methyltransferase CheR/two-component system chemotaxis response regulator CheB